MDSRIKFTLGPLKTQKRSFLLRFTHKKVILIKFCSSYTELIQFNENRLSNLYIYLGILIMLDLKNK